MTQRHRIGSHKDFKIRLGHTLFDVDDENKNTNKKPKRHTNF